MFIMDITDILNLFDGNEQKEIKKVFRENTMKFQHDPIMIEMLTNVYNSKKDLQDDKGLNVIFEGSKPLMNDNLHMILNSSFIKDNDINKYQSVYSGDVTNMFSSFMKILPDMVENVIEIKDAYHKTNKNKPIDDNLNKNNITEMTNLDIEPEPLFIKQSVSVKDLFINESIDVNYDYTIVSRDSLSTTIHKEVITVLSNDIINNNNINKAFNGNCITFGNGKMKRGNLEIEFDILPYNGFYLHNNCICYDIHITFCESIIGFIRKITLLDNKNINLNVNTKGKIIRNNDTKILKNMGFKHVDDNSTSKNLILTFIVNEYTIPEYDKVKSTISEIFC